MPGTMAGQGTTSSRPGSLLDLGFAKLDVLLGNGIVFLLGQLVGHGPRVLARDVIEAGVGARHELDLDGGGFGHDGTSKAIARRQASVRSRKVKKCRIFDAAAGS